MEFGFSRESYVLLDFTRVFYFCTHHMMNVELISTTLAQYWLTFDSLNKEQLILIAKRQ